jgi:ABC-2 type transport system ATP-binding protein
VGGSAAMGRPDTPARVPAAVESPRSWRCTTVRRVITAAARNAARRPRKRSPLLAVRAIRKAYGATLALDGVDLVVHPGTIVGLLGPNGAGKTTLVSVVAGLRRPDSGTVRVGGVDVVRDPQRAQCLIGLAPQDTGVYLPISVGDNLRFFAGLAGLRRRDLRRRVGDTAEALGLTALLGRRASELSGGERRRLHTAIALMHRPRLVLLDEPTAGADVTTRGEILRLVRGLADDGAAVLYSTHYLHEVEELDAHVAFIDHGRIVAEGGVDELIARYGSSALELTFEGPVPAAARVDGATVRNSSVRIASSDPAGTAAQLLPRLGPEASTLRAIEVARPSLEAVFLTVTGRRYDDAAASTA